MKQILTILFLALVCSVSAQVDGSNLPKITSPTDSDDLITAARGSFMGIRLDTLKTYFQLGQVDSVYLSNDTIYVTEGSTTYSMVLPSGGVSTSTLADSTAAVRADFPDISGLATQSAMVDTAAAIRADFPTGVEDGDKGDITVASGVWSIDAGAVDTDELAADAVTAAKIGTGEVGADELASTAVTPGSYTNADITVDAAGRITSASNGSGASSTYVPPAFFADDISAIYTTDQKSTGWPGGTMFYDAARGQYVMSPVSTNYHVKDFEDNTQFDDDALVWIKTDNEDNFSPTLIKENDPGIGYRLHALGISAVGNYVGVLRVMESDSLGGVLGGETEHTLVRSEDGGVSWEETASITLSAVTDLRRTVYGAITLPDSSMLFGTKNNDNSASFIRIPDPDAGTLSNAIEEIALIKGSVTGSPTEPSFARNGDFVLAIFRHDFNDATYTFTPYTYSTDGGVTWDTLAYTNIDDKDNAGGQAWYDSETETFYLVYGNRADGNSYLFVRAASQAQAQAGQWGDPTPLLEGFASLDFGNGGMASNGNGEFIAAVYAGPEDGLHHTYWIKGGSPFLDKYDRVSAGYNKWGGIKPLRSYSGILEQIGPKLSSLWLPNTATKYSWIPVVYPSQTHTSPPVPSLKQAAYCQIYNPSYNLFSEADRLAGVELQDSTYIIQDSAFVSIHLQDTSTWVFTARVWLDSTAVNTTIEGGSIGLCGVRRGDSAGMYIYGKKDGGEMDICAFSYFDGSEREVCTTAPEDSEYHTITVSHTDGDLMKMRLDGLQVGQQIVGSYTTDDVLRVSFGSASTGNAWGGSKVISAALYNSESEIDQVERLFYNEFRTEIPQIAYVDASVYVLDSFPEALAAYDVVKRRSDYSGPCWTIQRASDSDTLEVGFLNNVLDVAALNTFCTGTTCNLRKWWSQDTTTAGNHAIQFTGSLQPVVYESGAIIQSDNGYPAVKFPGADEMEVENNITNDLTSWTILTYFQVNSYAAASRIFAGIDATRGSDDNLRIGSTTGAQVYASLDDGTSYTALVSLAVDTDALITGAYDGTTLSVQKNNDTPVNAGTSPTSFETDTEAPFIGNRDGFTDYFTGIIQALYVMPTANDYSDLQTALQSN